MPKTPKESPKREPYNPYSDGLTPPKVIKKEVENDRPKHVFRLFKTRGNVFCVLILDHGKKKSDDGYAPYTFKVVRNQGEFLDKRNKKHSDDTLTRLGFGNWFHRRGPDGGDLLNETISRDGTQYARRAILWLLPKPDMEQKELERGLMQVISVTTKLNKQIDGYANNQYMFSIEPEQINPSDGQVVSLDYYFPDKEVIRILKAHYGDIPLPTFATDNPLRASVYFDPMRDTYPAEAHSWGYGDKITAATDDASVDLDDIDSYRAP